MEARPSTNPPVSSRRRRRGAFTIIEGVATLVVLSVVTAVAVAGYQANVSRTLDGSAEAEIEQVASMSLDLFLSDSDRPGAADLAPIWSSSIVEAVESVGETDGGVTFEAVEDAPGSPAASSRYGEVAWRLSADERVGFAMWNRNDRCTMGLITVRAVDTWTVKGGDLDADRCAGRFALAGEMTADEYNALDDPNDISVDAPTECIIPAGTNGSNGKINVTWTASEDPAVVGYELRRDGEPIAQLPADVTSHTDEGLPGNQGFRYTVLSVDNGNVRSAPQDCTPLEVFTAPEQPSGVVLDRDGDDVTVTWAEHEPADGITYTVFRDTLIDPAVELAAGTHIEDVDSEDRGVSADDLDVRVHLSQPNWAAGSVVVAGNFDAGVGGWELQLVNGALRLNWVSEASTDTITVSSDDTVPFTASTSGWIRATLDANDGAGAPQRAVTFFTSHNGLDWTQLGTTQTGPTTSIGTSAEPFTIGRSGATGPASVSAMRAFAGTGRSLIASFDAADIDLVEKTGVNAYGHTWNVVGAADVTGVTQTTFGPLVDASLVDDISTLPSGAAVRYQVKANAHGLGSPRSTPVALNTTLSAPDSVTAERGDRSALITWAPVTGAVSYTVQVAPDSAGAPNAALWRDYGTYDADGTGTCAIDDVDPGDPAVTASEPCAAVTGLLNDRTFHFRVRANAATGSSEWSAAQQATPLRNIGGVRNLQVVGGSPSNRTVESETLQVTWDPPADTSADNPVDQYYVRIWKLTGGSRPASPTATFRAPNSRAYIRALDNGSAYRVEVIAQYRTSVSPPVHADGTPFGQPEPPVVFASDPNVGGTAGNAGVRVDWRAPTDTGGLSITDYDVRCVTHPGEVLTTSGSTVDARRYINLTGLTPNVEYKCQARANTSLGSSEWGPYGPVFRAWGPPAAPEVAVAEKVSALGVAWNAAANNGRTIQRYEYRCLSTAGGAAAGPQTLATAGAATRDLSVTPQRAYTCSVRAYNGLWGPWGSDTGTAYRTPHNIVAPDAYGLPLPHSAVKVEWTDQAESVNDGGRPVTHYRSRCQNVDTGQWTGILSVTTATTVRQHNAGFDEQWNCQWAAYNAAGWSAWSPFSLALTPTAPAVTVPTTSTTLPPPPVTIPEAPSGCPWCVPPMPGGDPYKPNPQPSPRRHTTTTFQYCLKVTSVFYGSVSNKTSCYTDVSQRAFAYQRSGCLPSKVISAYGGTSCSMFTSTKVITYCDAWFSEYGEYRKVAC